MVIVQRTIAWEFKGEGSDLSTTTSVVSHDSNQLMPIQTSALLLTQLLKIYLDFRGSSILL